MSDHFLLTIGTDLSRPRAPRKVGKCRNVKGIDRSLFRADIAQSPLVIGSPDGVDDLLDLYNATLFIWPPHITGTCKTVSKNLYLLSQLRHFVDTPKRKLFYHVHISSLLTYASAVWDSCSDILFNKLNSLQRRAAKLMIPDSSLSTGTKLRYLGILPLKEKLMFNKAMLVFKAYKNLAAPYLKQLLSVPTFAPHQDI